jgi:Protein of unknown function (DUF2934)
MNERRELESKLEQTKRLSMLARDFTTRQRLLELQDELVDALEKFPHRRERIAEERVRERAHDLWEQHGSPQGRDQEFWHRAERELVESSSNHS